MQILINLGINTSHGRIIDKGNSGGLEEIARLVRWWCVLQIVHNNKIQYSHAVVNTYTVAFLKRSRVVMRPSCSSRVSSCFVTC